MTVVIVLKLTSLLGIFFLLHYNGYDLNYQAYSFFCRATTLQLSCLEANQVGNRGFL